MEDNSRYTRLAIRVAGLVGVFFLGRFIVKKIKEKKALREFGGISNITNNNQGNQLGTQQAGADYGIYAKQLKELMDGVDWFNRNETKILDTLRNMDCATRKAVEQAFNESYGEGQTLDDWLAGDLSGGRLQEARNYMTCQV